MKTRQSLGYHGTSPSPQIEDFHRKSGSPTKSKGETTEVRLPRTHSRSDGSGEIGTIKPVAVRTLPGMTRRLFALVRGVPKPVLRMASNHRNRSIEAERSKQRV